VISPHLRVHVAGLEPFSLPCSDQDLAFSPNLGSIDRTGRYIAVRTALVLAELRTRIAHFERVCSLRAARGRLIRVVQFTPPGSASSIQSRAMFIYR